MDWTRVDPPADGEDDPKTSANFQKIAACQRMNSQRLSEPRSSSSARAATKRKGTVALTGESQSPASALATGNLANNNSRLGST